LISWENNLSGYEQKSVAVTFTTQLEELEGLSPDFSNLFKVLSFFDPESIPLKIITEGAEALQLRSAVSSEGTTRENPKTFLLHMFKMTWGRLRGEPASLTDGHDISNGISSITVEHKSLTDLMCSPVQLQRAIQQLHCRSLVGYESNGDESVLRIHDLIQTTIQKSAKSEDVHIHWFHVAVDLVCCAFRNIDDPQEHTCGAQCEIFSPHIQSLTKWDAEHYIDNSDLDEANIRIALYLNSHGKSPLPLLLKQLYAKVQLRMTVEKNKRAWARIWQFCNWNRSQSQRVLSSWVGRCISEGK
jgi:hypothetical protein